MIASAYSYLEFGAIAEVHLQILQQAVGQRW